MDKRYNFLFDDNDKSNYFVMYDATEKEMKDKELLNQFVKICQLAHALASSADCSHPWAKGFKNDMLVNFHKLPKDVQKLIYGHE
jgi:hypothetical protein